MKHKIRLSKCIILILALNTLQATCNARSRPLFSDGVESCKAAGKGVVSNDCWEKYLISESKTNTDPVNRCHADLSLADFYEAQTRNNEAEAIYSKLIADNQVPDCQKWAKVGYKAFNEVRVGRQMPNFMGRDSKGQTIESASLRGRHVVLLFWSSSCGACKRAYEDLKTLQNTYKQPLVIIGISGDEDRSDYEKTIATNNLTWPNIMDGNDLEGPISNLYSIHRYPSIFVINPQGKIISHNIKILYPQNQK